MKNLFRVLMAFYLLLINQINAQQNEEKFDNKNGLVPSEVIVNEMQMIKSELNLLRSKLEETKRASSIIKSETSEKFQTIQLQIQDIKKRISDNNDFVYNKMIAVDDYLSALNFRMIISFCFLILAPIILFIILTKKQNKDNTNIHYQLQSLRSSIEESIVKEFIRHTELIEKNLQNNHLNISEEKTGSIDHSMALKLANEINTMEQNIRFMDPNTKGLRQLKKSIERLKNNLSANGYEILNLLNKPFNPGLNVIVVNAIIDENLEEGKEIISRVLIPSVLYKDQLIQVAQVEITSGVRK